VEWKAPVEIVERAEEQSFEFATGGVEHDIARWRYELRPEGDGTVLTERWQLRNVAFFVELGGEDEVARRAANARESIAATLAGMKAAAEAG
jgi:hypothetical protein